MGPKYTKKSPKLDLANGFMKVEALYLRKLAKLMKTLDLLDPTPPLLHQPASPSLKYPKHHTITTIAHKHSNRG